VYDGGWSLTKATTVSQLTSYKFTECVICLLSDYFKPRNSNQTVLSVPQVNEIQRQRRKR